MSDMVPVGKQLADARSALKLSRQKIADVLGLSPGAIWRIEAKDVFKAGELEKVLDWLGSIEKFDAGSWTPRSTPFRTVTIVDSETDFDTPQALVGVGFPVTYEMPPEPSVQLPLLSGADESPTQMSANDGMWRVSNSEVQTWKRCRRKWWFAYYRMLKRKWESPIGAMPLGSRVHEALRYAYLAEPELRMDPRDALEALIAIDFYDLMSNLTAEEWPDDVRHEEVIQKFKKEADLARVMIDGYVQWLEETGEDSELEITGSEVYLEAELPEMPDTLIISRLDARVRRGNSRLFIDHKTVGDFTQPARTLHMDEQMMMYILIERLQGEDTPVVGALYNMLKKSKRTQKATPPFFKRIEVHHNEITIGNFKTRLVGTLKDIHVARLRLNQGDEHRAVAYPTPKRDCAWDCPFFTVCGMTDDGSHAEGMIQQFFTVGDPLDYYVRGGAETPQSSDS